MPDAFEPAPPPGRWRSEPLPGEVILGIDPGSRATGYGVVLRRRGEGTLGMIHVAHGVLRPPASESLARRAAELHRLVREVIDRVHPDRAVVEQVFVSSSPRSALVLGQARGAALAALGGAGIPVEEISARTAKKAVVGTGAASKQQVQAMVRRLLELASPPPMDAADALALAIARAQSGPLAALGHGTRRGRARSALRVRAAAPGRLA